MKKNYKSATIVGKLKVYHYLSAKSKLKKHLPHTMSFSKKNLRKMVSEHDMLYIKPNVGSLGLGIFKVTQSDECYTVQTNKRTRSFDEITEMYHFIKSIKKKKKKLLIQEGIKLDKVRGKPYDLRAMVQRKPRGSWAITGIFAKVGKHGRIVTNFHQGGKLMTLNKLFKKLHLSADKAESRLGRISVMAMNTAQALSARKKGMREMGIDIAVEEDSKKLYIIEVNSRQPQFKPVKRISRTMYKRMMKYARAYGRKQG